MKVAIVEHLFVRLAEDIGHTTHQARTIEKPSLQCLSNERRWPRFLSGSKLFKVCPVPVPRSAAVEDAQWPTPATKAPSEVA